MHRTIKKQIGERQKNHALMVCHERPNHDARLSARQTRGGVIYGFVKTEFSCQPFCGKSLQIQARFFRRDHQRQCRRIGRDHQIIGKAAFEPQARYTECTILVVKRGVDRVVATFGYAPRHISLRSIGNVPGHGRVAGAVQQRVLKRRHDQQRHQVLEHRTAPRQQCRISPGLGKQTTQGKPAFLRKLSLRNRHETTQSRF